MPLDPSAFEQLFRSHYEPLCRFAARYVADGAVAEELVQDLFTRIWVDRARWSAPANERAYLLTAVRNRALNAGDRTRLESDWVAAERAWADETGDADDAQVRLEHAEEHERLDVAFKELPERCRMVMHLRWREQLSHAAIADVMGISVKGVEAQLARGLRALRSWFGAKAT